MKIGRLFLSSSSSLAALLWASVLLLLAPSASPAISVPVQEDTSTATVRGTEVLRAADGRRTLLSVTGGRRALLRFPLSNPEFLPANIEPANVNSATLQFYLFSAVNRVGGDLIVRKITGPWSDTENAPVPPVDPQPIAIIPASEIVARRFVSLDVTEVVRQELATGEDFGFAIEASDPAMRISLPSSKGPLAAVSARLEIAATPLLNQPGGENFFLGPNIGSTLTSTAVFNTAVGINTLAANQFGSSNTGLGHNALTANIDGEGNTAVGRLTLSANTGGSENTAVGDRTLQSNTTGNFNTAAGRRALFSNTEGSDNSAFGVDALALNSIGSGNTAVGRNTLASNSLGSDNTATGTLALFANTSGGSNTATGMDSLFFNSSGSNNTAVGRAALRANTTGSGNTAIGHDALLESTTGSFNIALGQGAGQFYSTGHHNIAIGNPGSFGESSTIRIGSTNQTRAFFAGIRGVTTGQNNAIPVLIDGNGQLGTTSSSRRYKENIADMGSTSERLARLRPVTFAYREPFHDGQKPTQFGLIAEEVAEVFPELAVLNEDGYPETVKYHDLAVLLLNEWQKSRAANFQQQEILRTQAQKLEEQATQILHLQESLAALTARTESIVRHLEASEMQRAVQADRTAAAAWTDP